MSDEITNPFARQMRQAERELKDAADVNAGERLIARDFAAEAFKQAPLELEKIKELLEQQAKECNQQRPSDYPELRFIPSGRLDAGKFAITMMTDIRLNDYLLRVYVGWHPNAATFMPGIDGLPPIRSKKYLLQANVDDVGFSWVKLETGEKYQAPAIVDDAMRALTDLLIDDRARKTPG